jgi:hypothetical protein
VSVVIGYNRESGWFTEKVEENGMESRRMDEAE